VQYFDPPFLPNPLAFARSLAEAAVIKSAQNSTAIEYEMPATDVLPMAVARIPALGDE
jgi:hypothetical protein